MRERTLDRPKEGLGDGTLVAAAAAGDPAAWDALVDRHAGLVWSVCRRFRLADTDAQDVSQTVWLRLVERLGTLRDPDAVAGWLATSTRNECIAVWRAGRRQTPVSPDSALDLALQTGATPHGDADDRPLDHDLLTEERHRALRTAVAGLPAHCRRLLGLLFADPPLTYEEIGARLDVSRGYIGPTRARCLGKLRDCPALAAYLRAEESRAEESAHERGGPPASGGTASNGGVAPVTPDIGSDTTCTPRSLLGVRSTGELVSGGQPTDVPS